ncbi:hypothetical protein HNR62_001028 [Oceanisphaera litoralis]|uniref:hypothetical protein n=1 Tax=Oceanisphaera litoralis TaxID=225144 RepID=UPI00195A0D57|nr:hypothetical protein [Oceanisphaera litoralis]MBM7455168.1 hypothetical protein [Oceanisphaera litoralis]
MPVIDITLMRGEVPRIADHLLPDDVAVVAKNCHFNHGIISPFMSDAAAGISLPAAPKTLYRYRADHWLQWPIAVDVVPSPIAQDPHGRVYYTDGNYPKVTTEAIALGSGAKPTAWYRLGLPAPPAVIVSSVAPPSGGSDDTITDDETRYYVQTWLTAFGEEGPPSPASLPVEMPIPGSAVALNLTAPAQNDRNITHRRLYRSVSGAGTADYLLVAELPIATASYTDGLGSDDLGPVLETYDYLPPPDNMRGLCLMANGIAAGFAGNEVLFSGAYLPYAWPQANRQTTQHDVVAIAASGTSLVVATKGYPYLFSGVTPSAINGVKLDLEQACVSARSMIVVAGQVIYASPDGLVSVGGNGGLVITEGMITRDQWQQYQPETLRAWAHEGKYIGLTDSHGFVFDPVSGDFRHFDNRWDAAWHDLERDSLYIAKGATLYRWRDGNTSITTTWRSKEFVAPVASAFNTLRVVTSDASKVGIKLLVDGIEVMSLAMGQMPAGAFRLPAVRGTKWQLEVAAQAEVERIILATSMAEAS